MRECWDEKGRSWHRFEMGGVHQNRFVARNFRPLRRVSDKEELFAVTQIGVGEAVIGLTSRNNKYNWMRTPAKDTCTIRKKGTCAR